MILDKYIVADVSKARSFFSFIFEQFNSQNNIKSVSSNIYPTRYNVTQFILSGNCSTCFGWYLHPSSGAHTNVSKIPDAVDTVVCAPDDGWRYHPKHVEQFPDKINCVTLHLVGYILEYYYDARTHER